MRKYDLLALCAESSTERPRVGEAVGPTCARPLCGGDAGVASVVLLAEVHEVDLEAAHLRRGEANRRWQVGPYICLPTPGGRGSLSTFKKPVSHFFPGQSATSDSPPGVPVFGN